MKKYHVISFTLLYLSLASTIISGVILGGKVIVPVYLCVVIFAICLNAIIAVIHLFL